MAKTISHLDYSDAAFIRKFEGLTLDPKLFNHEAHLRLTYIYLLIYKPEQALSRIRKAIKNFDLAFSNGIKYHETITTAMVKIILARILKGNTDNWSMFIKTNKDLLKSKTLLSEYYSDEVLNSLKAKKVYCSPDTKNKKPAAKKILSLAACLVFLVSLASCSHGTGEAHPHQEHNHHTDELKLSSKPVRVSQSATITLNGDINTVFPLFGPELEKKWAEGWAFDKIWFDSDNGGKNAIFQTRSHHAGHPGTTWVISQLDTVHSKTIEYITFNPHWVTIVNIQCSPSDGATQAVLKYTYTSLTDKGSEKVPELLKNMYAQNMKDWEEAINYYLKNNKTLIH